MNAKYSKFIVPGVIVGILLIIGLWIGGTYNSLVGDREKVTTAFSNVETQYQRRSDLVKNLVATVEGSSNFEKDTLTAVTDARAQVGKVTIDANASSEQVKQYVEAQNQLTSSLSRLIAVAENYPDIKSTAAYQDLMSQLEGTENRIQVARSDFNEVARPYNTRLQTFPTNVLANLFGFTQRAYFQSESGSDKAPTVNFGN
ncbi:MAG: LemA family protein [Candidatus Saccharimonas sp.]